MITYIVSCDLCEAMQPEGITFTAFPPDGLLDKVHVCGDCSARQITDLAATLATVRERAKRVRAEALRGSIKVTTRGAESPPAALAHPGIAGNGPQAASDDPGAARGRPEEASR